MSNARRASDVRQRVACWIEATAAAVAYMDPAPSERAFVRFRVKPVAAISSARVKSSLRRSGPDGSSRAFCWSFQRPRVPSHRPALLAPLIAGESNVVYGMRTDDNPRRGPLLFFGVKLLTLVTNLLYGCRIHDEATGYKAFRLSLLKRIELECERFEFCPEVTAKVCRLGERIVEVPVSYRPRTAAAGKKLRWTDGASALATLIRYRFQPRRRFDRGYSTVEGALASEAVASEAR
jgi:hypothetical protein